MFFRPMWMWQVCFILTFWSLSFPKLTVKLDLIEQVHYKFELLEETLFLTINLIDRFLERQAVIRKKLQLVGVTAMLIACKYEEVSVPTVEDFVLITDKAYTRNEVLNMVSQFLCTLLFFLFFVPLIIEMHLIIICRHRRN